jgi:hypothetical protein
MTFSPLPSRRHEDLTVQGIGDETLVYDETRHRAFCLNATSATVWRLSDGRRTVEQIADAATIELQLPVTREIVEFALSVLRRDGLLQADSYPAGVHAVSRRALIKKLGVGAALMVPVVTAVFAPPAAHAGS